MMCCCAGLVVSMAGLLASALEEERTQESALAVLSNLALGTKQALRLACWRGLDGLIAGMMQRHRSFKSRRRAVCVCASGRPGEQDGVCVMVEGGGCACWWEEEGGSAMAGRADRGYA